MALKKVLKVVALVLIVIILVVGGYIIYISAGYNRIPDEQELDVDYSMPAELSSVFDDSKDDIADIPLLRTDTQYSATTYNIGFGAYDRDFSFFLDKNKLRDGTPLTGLYSRATDKDAAIRNTDSVISVITAQSPDIAIFQEADRDADRSRHVDQVDAITAKIYFPVIASNWAYATNMHTGYLFYPLTHPIGQVKDGGILTMSKYRIESSVRRSFPVTDAWPAKFFDLDRCFTVSRMPVEGSESVLVMINVHTSAYDKGGLIRKEQMKMLSEVAAGEYKAGNWVIIGGDFNHAIHGTLELFMGQMQVPGWAQPFDESMVPGGFSLVEAVNFSKVATCRDTSMPYTPGVNYEVTVDGFMVSANVEAKAENIDADYDGSDHNPVRLEFTLNGQDRQGGQGE
jgi:endonuclease/exonuclease/phosphatase family metal-dependent hydrolase